MQRGPAPFQLKADLLVSIFLQTHSKVLVLLNKPLSTRLGAFSQSSTQFSVITKVRFSPAVISSKKFSPYHTRLFDFNMIVEYKYSYADQYTG